MSRVVPGIAVFDDRDPRSKCCPVCDSRFVSFVRHVGTRRTKRPIPLYFCMDCRSFWNDSGYVEDEAQLKRDLEWGIGVSERNKAGSKTLLEELKTRNVDTSRILEIGCGIGTFLSVARDNGSAIAGFDVNKEAIEYGRGEYGINLVAETWRPEMTDSDTTLIVSISTLEHIRTPRDLFFSMAAAAKQCGSAMFVSVPIITRERWHFIDDADPFEKGTWLFDNDVHVTHFSSEGLRGLFTESGAREVTWIARGLWQGVVGFY